VSEETKYRGIAIFLGSREYVVPALSVRHYRDHFDLLIEPVGKVTPANFSEKIDKFLPIIGMALRRNYPDLTDEELLDALDLVTFFEALRAVQKASGMTEAKPGEAVPVAEESTGANSTAPSSPLPGGPSSTSTP
jgi:hypothetical protein